MQGLNYNDRLKQLGLMKLEEQRMRSDLIETFKIVNGQYGRRGHDLKLFKKRFRLDVRENVFLTELLIIGICYLPATSTVALLTLSRNISRLNWNRKLYILKCVTCDSRRYTAKACAYSCQHRLWHASISEFSENKFGEFGEKAVSLYCDETVHVMCRRRHDLIKFNAVAMSPKIFGTDVRDSTMYPIVITLILIRMWLYNKLSLRVIFSNDYTPPKPHFSTHIPIACQLYEHANKKIVAKIIRGRATPHPRTQLHSSPTRQLIN